MGTPDAALRAAVAADPSRPLVTHLGALGRTELSVRTYENNVAKAAGLLRDGLDVTPGDRVALLLPPHWQAAVWLGACWAVGAVVVLEDAADVAVALATADRLAAASGAGEVLRVSEHPLGLPSPEPLPPGVQESAVEVRAHGDVFVPYDLPADDDPALSAGALLTAGEVMARATELAAATGTARGGRLLVTSTALDVTTALALGAVPLVVAGSVVLAPGATDPAAVSQAERTTATLPPPAHFVP